MTSDENDGPRGRIYLMRAVEEGRLANTSNAFRTHIDRCLGCRACEAACPAGVEYGHLLEAARAEISRGHKEANRCLPSAEIRFASRLVEAGASASGVRVCAAFARFGFTEIAFENEHSARAFAAVSIWACVVGGIACQYPGRVATVVAGKMPANPDSSGKMRAPPKVSVPVQLFKGCVTEGLFKRVNDATARVMQVNGCAVQVPEQQICCGALHAHAGDLEGARELARQNIEAFDAGANGGQPPSIVTNAGGCGAMLVSYAHLLADDPKYAERAKQFSARVRDIGQQLETIGFRNGANIGYERTTYDASCHLLHGQRATDASLQMLWAIPDLKFAHLNGSDVCCGGAGVYNLLEPQLSRAVLDEKLKHINESGAEVLTTGNPGCHMQIAAGAKLVGMNLRVCHPVELLDESYARAGFYNTNQK